MKKLLNFLLFASLMLIVREGFGQNFKLLKTLGTKSGFDRIQRVSAEPNGGCSFLFAYVTSGTQPDTLKLGSYQYIKNSAYASANFLVRLDSGGNILKVRLISLGKDLNNMCRDEKGNFYIAGQIAGSSVFDGITLSGSKGNLVYAKYDSDLNRIWMTQTGYSANPYDLYYSQGHLLFTCRASPGTTTIGPKTFSFTYTNFVYGEIDQSNGSIKWCNNFYKSGGTTDYIHLTGLQYLKGNFFVTGISSKDLKIDSLYFYKGGFIIKTDSVGKIKQSIHLRNNKYLGFTCLTSDGESLYTSGNDLDSFYLEGKKVYSPNGELTVASFTSGLKLRWQYQPKVLDKTKITGGPVIATSNQGYIYFGGVVKTKIEMGGNVITPAGTKDVFLFKMDELGTVLWATNGGTNGEMFGLDAIAGRYVFAGGYFEKKITFAPFMDSAKGETDGWLTKIMDNSIFRGNVIKGPYCAGDTIKVPYTKFGEFDTSNYFIAELSDENGRFETGVIELGRIKSNKEGIVIGKLPTIQVASSGKYNIRIRSTNPALQSFYRTDTLNLLIYSRDKANPGPPETICFGDTLTLNTFGGSKWTWNPAYNMSDSNKRQPLVWPTRDTVYRIIIADSFGCGQPDTAFKKVFVRPLPKAILGFNDTLLCNNTPFQIPAKFVGGDSVYNWHWLAAPLFNQWLSLGKGALKSGDTILYRPAAKISNNERVAIILSDGCTAKPDTAYLTVSYRTPVVIKPLLKDTTICPGHQLFYKANATGGVSKYMRYEWKDIKYNILLSTTDALSITSYATKIMLIMNDGCDALGDTSIFNIISKPALKAITNLRDTALCFGSNLNLSTSGNGGDSTSYNYTWFLDNKIISTSNVFILKSDENYTASTSPISSKLILVLKDNCSLPNDTISKTLIIKSTPKADFSFDAACAKTPIHFSFTGIKPNPLVGTVFNWNFDNKIFFNIENPEINPTAVSQTFSAILSLTSSNGCTDTVIKIIEVKPQSRANFTTADVCEKDSAVFKNLSLDATGYNWRFGDGLKSNLTSPKHLYTIGGITQTYNVTLVAIVADGCSDSTVKAITINAAPNSSFGYTRNLGRVEFKAAQTGQTSYQWNFGNGDSTTTSNPNFTYSYSNTPAKYNVCLKVTNSSGCISQTCKDVEITVGMSFITSGPGFKIYPNPNKGQFIIEIDKPSSDISVGVYDIMGKVIYNITTVPNQLIYPINLNSANNSGLPVVSGIYIVKVSNGTSVWNQRIFVTGRETNP